MRPKSEIYTPTVRRRASPLLSYGSPPGTFAYNSCGYTRWIYLRNYEASPWKAASFLSNQFKPRENDFSDQVDLHEVIENNRKCLTQIKTFVDWKVTHAVSQVNLPTRSQVFDWPQVLLLASWPYLQAACSCIGWKLTAFCAILRVSNLS